MAFQKCLNARGSQHAVEVLHLLKYGKFGTRGNKSKSNLQIKSTLYLESSCSNSMRIIMLSSLFSELLNTEMSKRVILPVLEYVYEILSLTLRGGT